VGGDGLVMVVLWLSGVEVGRRDVDAAVVGLISGFLGVDGNGAGTGAGVDFWRSNLASSFRCLFLGLYFRVLERGFGGSDDALGIRVVFAVAVDLALESLVPICVGEDCCFSGAEAMLTGGLGPTWADDIGCGFNEEMDLFLWGLASV
jgi:hypothetical protein